MGTTTETLTVASVERHGGRTEVTWADGSTSYSAGVLLVKPGATVVATFGAVGGLLRVEPVAGKPRGRCSWCGESRALRQDGTVGWHRVGHFLMGRIDCPGAGRTPSVGRR